MHPRDQLRAVWEERNSQSFAEWVVRLRFNLTENKQVFFVVLLMALTEAVYFVRLVVFETFEYFESIAALSFVGCLSVVASRIHGRVYSTTNDMSLLMHRIEGGAAIVSGFISSFKLQSFVVRQLLHASNVFSAWGLGFSVAIYSVQIANAGRILLDIEAIAWGYSTFFLIVMILTVKHLRALRRTLRDGWRLHAVLEEVADKVG